MQFPLSAELIGQIIFAMEDQQHRFLIDRRSGELVREEEVPDGGPGAGPALASEQAPEEPPVKEDVEEASVLDGKSPGKPDGYDRYVPIPAWGPTEGFHLMEHFVLKLRNPIFAEMLREALSSGKGVFRKFKDIVKKNREIERYWLAFKDREMRRVVEQWYDDQRELMGLERLAAEAEPEEDLTASDFTFQRGQARHLEPVLRLDKKAWLEQRPELESGRAEDQYRASREALPPLLDRRSLFLVAEAASAELAGFAWAVEEQEPLAGGLLLRLAQLAVRKHFRGIGLASLLVKHLIAEARDRGYARVVVPLRGPSLALEPLFADLGFRPRSVELEVDPMRWEEQGGQP